MIKMDVPINKIPLTMATTIDGKDVVVLVEFSDGLCIVDYGTSHDLYNDNLGYENKKDLIYWKSVNSVSIHNGNVDAVECKYMWEILVPTISNDGKPFRTRFHRVWDGKVRDITGGLTIMPKTTNGEWVEDGVIYREQTIPVRIMATTSQIETIARMTAKYYDQIAIMYYKISDTVRIYRNE